MSTDEAMRARAEESLRRLESGEELTEAERQSAPQRFGRAVERRRKQLSERASPPLLPSWAACPPPRSHMVDEEF